MSTKPVLSKHFEKIKHICGGLSMLLLLWLGCHLFIRSCGGPFPDRTRGPFAPYRYYQLADFPDWENQIKPDPETGKTRMEILMETGRTPPIHFGTPDVPRETIDSATPSVKVQ
ncbi:MAG: hypothetical protein JXR73_13285 [Candidatus Omnitrophica bacterium]|nr:hypothetical protein [Candidatus Omnitrophota bacterium]